MDDLIKQMSSPTWWISTIVIAFFVNILAAYAKPLADKFVSKWSEQVRERLRIDREQREKVVDYLIEQPSRLVDIRTDAIFTSLRVIQALLWALFWTITLEFLTKITGSYAIYDISRIGIIVIYLYFIISGLQQFARYRRLRIIIDQCAGSIHTFESMPPDIVDSLRREDAERKTSPPPGGQPQ
ncbi:hypothetical protein [Bremerella sp.]|uniref:hypothetical protein n=1 Tax=Bremerella sp. TaxID=2795602 RepID=UPI0039188A9B